MVHLLLCLNVFFICFLILVSLISFFFPLLVPFFPLFFFLILYFIILVILVHLFCLILCFIFLLISLASPYVLFTHLIFFHCHPSLILFPPSLLSCIPLLPSIIPPSLFRFLIMCSIPSIVTMCQVWNKLWHNMNLIKHLQSYCPTTR